MGVEEGGEGKAHHSCTMHEKVLVHEDPKFVTMSPLLVMLASRHRLWSFLGNFKRNLEELVAVKELKDDMENFYENVKIASLDEIYKAKGISYTSK